MTRLLRKWPLVVPAIALLGLVFTWGRDLPSVVVIVVAILLIGAVLAAVHHAEVIAHRVGEPFGSLVLAVAVTVIEVALIITLMTSGKAGTESLARDTAFAAVMITCNGILGLSLLLGATKHRLVRFNPEGAGAALAVVATLTTLTLVLPTFTEAAPDGRFSGAQLAFIAVVALVLYGVFVQTQTNRHRDFFLPVDSAGKKLPETAHASPPPTRTALISLVLLIVALVSVVGLAKGVSPAIEDGVRSVGIPSSFVGVVIALLVLLPEGISASRAALRNRMQVSLNLGLGSAMATIGLTIPAIAVASIWLPTPLQLGLGPVQIVLFALTIIVTTLTVVPGRATRLQGVVHLTLLAAFIFLAISP